VGFSADLSAAFIFWEMSAVEVLAVVCFDITALADVSLFEDVVDEFDFVLVLTVAIESRWVVTLGR
jgi:hypothetical protein